MVTNDNNSLLAHLAYKFSGQTETTATEALGYILSRSEAARNALRDTLKTGGAHVGPIARVQTEVIGKKMERIDLSAYNEADEERVLIEAKFWASLTGNQPSEYLNRLPNDGKPSALLFVAPESRLETLWPEVCDRARKEFAVDMGSETGDLRTAAIAGSERRLMLTSWRAMLGAMASRASVDGDSAAERDILQLNALCEREDTEEFRPLRGNEVSPDFPRFQAHLINLVGDAVTRSKNEEVISSFGPWTSTVESHGMWITIVGATALIHINYRHWAKERETPVWLSFTNSGDTKLEAVRERLQPDLAPGKDILPIYLPLGVEREAVLNAIVERLREVGKLLASPAPRESGNLLGGDHVFYYLYTRPDGSRAVAFGDNYGLRNVHVVTADGLAQTEDWTLDAPPDDLLEDSDVATMEEIEERFGKLVRLEDQDIVERNRLELEPEAERRRAEAARRRLSAPIDFVRVPDEVMEIERVPIEDVRAKIPEIHRRQDELAPDRRERYDRFLDLALMLHRPEPTLRQWASDALMAFASLEHAEYRDEHPLEDG